MTGTRDRSTTMKKCSSSTSIFSSTNSVATCYHITHIHTTHSHFVTMNAQTLEALPSLSTWPAHYHPVFIMYITYINLRLHMAWCYFRSHSSVGWRKHFSTQVSQVINHVISRATDFQTLSFIHTNLPFSRAIPKEGFQQCFEQWKCQLIQCISVQGDDFKGNRNHPCERYSPQLVQGHSRTSTLLVITKLENCTFFLLGM